MGKKKIKKNTRNANRELEFLKKKLEILKTILKQKEEWEMQEDLFEQNEVNTTSNNI
jgi:hypothetical protein